MTQNPLSPSDSQSPPHLSSKEIKFFNLKVALDTCTTARYPVLYASARNACVKPIKACLPANIYSCHEY